MTNQSKQAEAQPHGTALDFLVEALETEAKVAAMVSLKELHGNDLSSYDTLMEESTEDLAAALRLAKRHHLRKLARSLVRLAAAQVKAEQKASKTNINYMHSQDQD